MPRLPVVSGEKVVRAFKRLGYKCAGRSPLSIPLSNPVKRGLLRNAIRDSGFSVEEFVEAL